MHVNMGACDHQRILAWDHGIIKACVHGEHVSMGECDHHLKIDEGVATWLSVQEL